MSNTNSTSTGGYLQPVLPSVSGLRPGLASVADDDVLAILFQQMVVGITGLPAQMVRPRWQTHPPTRPPPEADWAAVGVTDNNPLPGSPYQKHSTVLDADGNSTDDSYSTLQTHWKVVALISFYGPHVGYYSGLISDGLSIDQNREPLAAAGLRLMQIGDVTRTAELVNTQWYGRADVRIEFVREVDRDYQVKSFVSIPVVITDDLNHSTNTSIPLP